MIINQSWISYLQWSCCLTERRREKDGGGGGGRAGEGGGGGGGLGEKDWVHLDNPGSSC